MNKYIADVYFSRPSFGSPGSVPIDQTPSQDFNVNPHTGRPMSDIQRLVHIQNDLQLAAEFAQLQEFKPKFLPKDMTDEDAIKFAVPRLSQLPSELIAHRVKLAKMQFDKVQAQKKQELEKVRLESQQKFFENLKESKSD